MLFSDDRFAHLFTQVYQQKENGLMLKHWLIIETEEGPNYQARSKIECSIMCFSIINCTAMNYFIGNKTCHMQQPRLIALP